MSNDTPPQVKAQRKVYRAYVNYLESVRRMCIYAWARFDLLSMALGMVLLAAACACMVGRLVTQDNGKSVGESCLIINLVPGRFFEQN